MKIQILILILITFLSVPTIAAEMTIYKNPRLEIYTDKNSYYAGEKGTITAEIETFGEIQEAEIEMEILSPSGQLVYGDLLYTKIPRESVINPYSEQTVQVLYDEDIGYVSPEKTIRRHIGFEVPIDMKTGTYTINTKLVSPYMTLEKSKFLYISGEGEFIDFIIIIYIVILVFSLYLIWRD